MHSFKIFVEILFMDFYHYMFSIENAISYSCNDEQVVWLSRIGLKYNSRSCKIIFEIFLLSFYNGELLPTRILTLPLRVSVPCSLVASYVKVSSPLKPSIGSYIILFAIDPCFKTP